MSATLTSTPAADGFRMPGEFSRHAGCWMAWPERPDNWRWGAKPAQEAFAAVAEAINVSEPVTMAVSDAQFDHCRSVLSPSIRVVEMTDRRLLDARRGADVRRRRPRRPARRRLALQRLGRARGRPLLPLAPRRARRPEGARDRADRPLPGADRARGRLDPRRRRGHGAHDRGVPAEPQPQPRRSRASRSSAPARLPGREQGALARPRRLQRRDRRPRRQPRLLRAPRRRRCSTGPTTHPTPSTRSRATRSSASSGRATRRAARSRSC